MPEKKSDINAKLDRILAKLERRPNEELNRITFEGRAVSRSEDSLHLATSQGIVAIPLRAVADVTSLEPDDPSIISVEVDQADEVRQLLKVRPPLPGEPNPTPGVILRPSPTRLRACGCDTATITGGKPDATDDFIIIVSGW